MRPFLLATAATCLFASSPAKAEDRTYAVQVGVCRAHSSYPTFATINAAVAAVGGSQGSSGTVYICPGTYPEQVVITRNISLRGVSDGQGSQVHIVPPPGGLVVNAQSVFDGTPYSAQIVVKNARGPTLSGLTVDGTGNNLSGGCGTNLAGILLQNASGVIESNVVSNQIQPNGLDGCQTGLAIYAQKTSGSTDTIVVRSNFVSNFQKNGITGNGQGLVMRISNNTVVGRGPTTGAAENGIQVAFGATGTITQNYVSDTVYAPLTASDPGNAASGILVYASPKVQIADNVVTTSQYGIVTAGDTTSGLSTNTLVLENRIAATLVFDGIDICGTTNATVRENIVSGSTEAGIHIDSSCGTRSSAAVLKNTINGACAGLLIGPGSVANAVANNYLNVATNVVGNSDVCAAVAVSAASARSAAAVSRTFVPAR